MFPRNENALDRGVRAAVGSGLIVASVAAFGLGSGKPMGVLSALGGAVLLLTAATGSCLLYRLAGVDTSATDIRNATESA